MNMNIRRYLSITICILWRAFQVGVVIPATIVGSIFLALNLAGQTPAQKAVAAIYSWAEISVRPASPGSVRVDECQHSDDAPDEQLQYLRPPVLCESTAAKEITLREFSRTVSLQLQSLYVVLLLMSSVAVLVAYPGRRFFGLGEPHAQGTQ